MNFRQIKPATFALMVAGVFILVVDAYTENGGFKLAGGLILLAAIVLAFNQASKRPDNS